jgi:hypothetical protein
MISQDRPPITDPSVTTVKRRSRKDRREKSVNKEHKDSEIDLAEIEKELDRFKEVLDRTYAQESRDRSVFKNRHHSQ